MKNVLVVDDEETLLLIMVNRFEDYADQFNVFTARNGKEAVEVLESESIDFLVTDLKMPEMDGIELLALMSSKYPHIPAMAMSAFSTPEIEKKLAQMGTLQVLDKPVNFDLLADAILKGLDRSHEGGSINCVSVSSFLQLIKMEDKTCSLEVHGENDKRGFIYIKHGELFDAECDGLDGESAALEIISWDSSQLFINDLPRDKQENKINKGLMSVVMEGVRLRDEREAAGAAEADSAKPVSGRGEESVVDESEPNFDLEEPDFSAGEPEEKAAEAQDDELTFELDESELADLEKEESVDDGELNFELDEPDLNAEIQASEVDDGDLSFDFDEVDTSDALEPEPLEEKAGGETESVSPNNEAISADNEDLDTSQESIFGDAALDFAMEQLGPGGEDGGESTDQSVDDESGLNFSLDDLDGITEIIEESDDGNDQFSAAKEAASNESADAGDNDGGLQAGLDDFDIGSFEEVSDTDVDGAGAFDIEVPASGDKKKTASAAPVAKAEGREGKTRPVGSIEKIFRSLNSEQQLPQVLNTVLKTLQRAVPFDLAVLMMQQLNNPEHLQIDEIVVRGSIKSVQYNRIPYKGAELAAVMKKGKSLILDDTSLLKGPLEKKMFCQHGLTSCLIIPLKINGNAAGVLTLGARKQDVFSETRQYVEWVANGIALAIERDRLALEARRHQLTISITEQISQALITMKYDFNKVLNLVLSIVQEQLNAEAGLVYLKSGEGLTLASGTGPDGKAVKKKKLKEQKGIAWQVIKQESTILVNDMSQLSDEYAEAKNLFKFETRSVLSAPLLFDQKAIGVIEVRNKREGDYNSRDEMLVQAIGASLGIALENSRCYKQKKGKAQPEKDLLDSLQRHIVKQVDQVAA